MKDKITNLCDECHESIDDIPKDGWLGFATTKEGYLYCGRCFNTKGKFGKIREDMKKGIGKSESTNESKRILPAGFKVYLCTDCQEINIKKDNRRIKVGYCDTCDHPIWNDYEDVPEDPI